MIQHNKLIIAEKPSVAKQIATVVGATENKDGYIQGSDYIVSWCIGHLVGFANPDIYDIKYKSWKREDLPIIPIDWKFTVSKDKKKQLNTLNKLINSSKIDSVICATDAGREGELIYRLVHEYCNCTKPVKRLWISSMEIQAIKDGLANMKPLEEYDKLYQSAICRAKADWLVGMNATRLFSILYDTTLNIGRVMTPTLALIVERDRVISNFIVAPHYTPQVEFDGFKASCLKFRNKEEAQAVQSDCENQKLIVSNIESEKKKIAPPRLYDLTTLQREANRMHGFTAKQTLEYLQSMYEKQLVTYPRTDSRFITQDMKHTTLELVQSIALVNAIESEFEPNIDAVIDDQKVSDHHAIIPTAKGLAVKNLEITEAEHKILKMISLRLFCATAETHEYENTTITLSCGKHNFTLNGKKIIKNGWKKISEFEKYSTKNNELEKEFSTFNIGQTIESFKTIIKEGVTSPPTSYTEDTLLSSMVSAGYASTLKPASASEAAKHIIENEQEETSTVGIGTPATRADIIEKLIKIGFIERKSKKILPTERGKNIIAILPDIIKSPKLTAEWEESLLAIEKGEMQADKFLSSINGFLESLISTSETSKAHMHVFSNHGNKEMIGICPRCGSTVLEQSKGFFCDNSDCKFVIWKNNKFLLNKKVKINTKFVATLLKEGRIFIDKLYSKKTDKTYSANILLDDTGQHVNFKLEFANGD